VRSALGNVPDVLVVYCPAAALARPDTRSLHDALPIAARAEAGACELAHRDRGRDVDGEGGGGHPAGGHDQREGADPATGAKGEAAAAAVGLLGHGEVGHGLVGEDVGRADACSAVTNAAGAVAAAARAEAGA